MLALKVIDIMYCLIIECLTGFRLGVDMIIIICLILKKGRPDRLWPADEGPFYEDGISFNMSYVYKQFVLRAYYHRGLKDNSVYGANHINLLPINYFGFWMGYRIKLFDPIKIGGKKQTCPTF
jgi:hypothetical protein